MLKLLKDPVFHFALLGAGFFAAYLLVDPTGPVESEIVITEEQQRQTIAGFTRVWGREPSEAELKALHDEWLREELANREARAMGLAADDIVIRRRLRQKYESVMEQMASAVTPTDEELRRWYRANSARYALDAQFAFRHLFFSSDRRENAFEDAREALETLGARSSDNAETPGDALALPAAFGLTTRSELANRFGSSFAEAMDEHDLGQWSGPVESAFGFHLVFLEEAVPERSPDLAEVRTAVLRDWRDEHLNRARDALYEELLQRYSVRFETPLRPDER